MCGRARNSNGATSCPALVKRRLTCLSRPTITIRPPMPPPHRRPQPARLPPPRRSTRRRPHRPARRLPRWCRSRRRRRLISRPRVTPSQRPSPCQTIQERARRRRVRTSAAGCHPCPARLRGRDRLPPSLVCPPHGAPRARTGDSTPGHVMDVAVVVARCQTGVSPGNSSFGKSTPAGCTWVPAG